MNASEGAKKFILRCLEVDVGKGPSAGEAAKDPVSYLLLCTAVPSTVTECMVATENQVLHPDFPWGKRPSLGYRLLSAD